MFRTVNITTAKKKQMSLRLPGAASLVEHLDCKILAVLRDGKHLVGVLRSFDQFSNIILEDAVERRNVGKQCVDIPLGLFILRGDNIVLLGSLNEQKEQQELQFVDSPALLPPTSSKTQSNEWEKW